MTVCICMGEALCPKICNGLHFLHAKTRQVCIDCVYSITLSLVSKEVLFYKLVDRVILYGQTTLCNTLLHLYIVFLSAWCSKNCSLSLLRALALHLFWPQDGSFNCHVLETLLTMPQSSQL